MSEESLVMKQRHTLSHIMAAAVKRIYAGTTTLQFGVGPAIDDGFYYDIDFGGVKVSDEDLKKIEKEMRKIIAQKLPMVYSEKSRTEALKWAEENGQKFKAELINDLPDEETISFYTLGEFEDLCKGPHVEDTGKVGAFKLDKVAGAYWRGDEKREMLTRIYGLAFETQEELDEYVKKQEEAKARDHRKLGKELDLFCFSELVGSGLPMFTPRGTILRDILNDFSQSYRIKAGYQKVCIPHIALVDLYKTSGHYEKFPEMLQFVSQESGDHLALKPVNCPHHSQIFASQPRSYKELPIKYLETTMVYRDERKGELGGLSRVRSITQDDSHVFCTEDQIGQIFGELIAAAQDLYKRIDMNLKLRLSFRDDGDGYTGTPEMWEKAQGAIQAMADKHKIEYFIGIGEAAMYGPKMDFMATDALGREWQVATVQLDYATPTRFGLEYTAEDGSKKTPVMIHCALVGSIERFMSVLIEHTAGWFPFWMAPEQVRVLTINDSVADYAEKIRKILDETELDEPLEHRAIRYTFDDRNESLGKKIREATKMKIPCVLIVGPKDAEAGEVSVRLRDSEEKVKLDKLAEYLRSL
ncbi:threonine--tRNA ligase [Candidatus Saccharibacteria bacterium]|nr:threonine--tRNA ligase [Candidatus Saccharibacteria bacterium]MBR6961923.1 threonine--tRNA ligase [Candidatus Saccharibacteria bacterium]